MLDHFRDEVHQARDGVLATLREEHVVAGHPRMRGDPALQPLADFLRSHRAKLRA